MNPFALLLIAAAAGGRAPGSSYGAAPLKLDALLDQLHGAVNTLEKVNELSRLGNHISDFPARPAPSSAHIPSPVQQPESASETLTSYSPAQTGSASLPNLPNIDLQSAMQTLGPILSMLGNNQNSK